MKRKKLPPRATPADFAELRRVSKAIKRTGERLEQLRRELGLAGPERRRRNAPHD